MRALDHPALGQHHTALSIGLDREQIGLAGIMLEEMFSPPEMMMSLLRSLILM
jgi:hypothetical protein